MFTLRQITCAGFFGVYSGCIPLTVNLARLPYWRGALIGVAFGALTHVMVTLIYIMIAVYVGQIMGDPILKQPTTWGIILLGCIVIQVLSAIGCRIMGGYFLSPPNKRVPFERQKLYENLKNRDTGKTSVLHDVVLKLEQKPALKDMRFSNAWVVFFSILSVLASSLWIYHLTIACLESIFYGIPMDAAWYVDLALRCLLPLVMLVLVHLSVLGFLGTRGIERQAS
ncbi:MAG: hypothetical protein J6A01_05510 [Proteobacteria bacterium]|nr:hypothetical protein [Pseudomonadota bacterium]